MALPVRISREQGIDPFEIIRNDFQMLNRFFGSGGLGGDGGEGPMGLLSSFPVDVREDENHVIVEAELPGFNKEDIDISLENGTLTITAEHQEERAEPAGEQQQQQQQGQPGQGEAGGGGGAGAGAGAGMRQARRQQGQGNYLLRERRVQRLVRSFTLPPNVDEQNVQASYENGVLRVVLNKREESKPKRIQVS
jgi:HSP20 family protein